MNTQEQKKHPLPIFNPSTVVELSGGRKIEVRELTWPDALEFFNQLRAQTKGLQNEKGELALEPAKVMDAIGDNLPLVTWLVDHSTDITEDDLTQLRLSEMLDLVTAALKVNLGIIASRLKNVRGRLAAVMGATGEATKKSSETSSVSST